jgi:hypothetical protein
LGLLSVTALLTPLTFQDVANPSFGAMVEAIFASGFLTDTPLLATIWACLTLSFALGSVPSREDLSSMPLLFTDLWRLCPLGWSSRNRFRECSLLSDLRSVSARRQSLRPASHGSCCRCPHDGTCRTGDSVLKPEWDRSSVLLCLGVRVRCGSMARFEDGVGARS